VSREFIGFFGKMHAISRQVPARDAQGNRGARTGWNRGPQAGLNSEIDWKSRAAAFRMVSFGPLARCTAPLLCPDL